MMAAALDFFSRRAVKISNPSSSGRFVQRGIDAMFSGPMALVRIQWTGPWIINGKPQKWAARQTHWIAAWAERGVPLVFDVNCGIQGFLQWEHETVPRITETVDRADGGWFPMNVWRLISERPVAKTLTEGHGDG
jgi:hypothetical protein